jgi:hypothetical protein
MSPDPNQRPENCREFVEDLLGRSTRPSQLQQAAAEGDVWYMIYQDELGQSHTVKGEKEGIRRALRDGLLGDATTMTASRTKAGPFQELRAYPEFRDLLISPSALPQAAEPRPSRPITTLAPPAPPVAARTPPAARKPQPDWRKPAGSFDRTPAPADSRLARFPLLRSRRAAFDIVLWVTVLTMSLIGALMVFHFFPPR